jgi:hypothetical protein
VPLHCMSDVPARHITLARCTAAAAAAAAAAVHSRCTASTATWLPTAAAALHVRHAWQGRHITLAPCCAAAAAA